jgi:leader peptidase (prepilin peptidase)/N-methyltransferase
MTLIVPTVAALATGGVFAAVHSATKGGIGFGDVKLATVIGLAVGSLGLTAAWLSVLTGSLTALVWAKASRQRGSIPLGPWLLSGAWIASLVIAGAAA